VGLADQLQEIKEIMMPSIPEEQLEEWKKLKRKTMNTDTDIRIIDIRIIDIRIIDIRKREKERKKLLEHT
jgi:hypothetical protein